VGDDDVMRVQYVRKRCRQLQNGRTDTRSHENTAWPSAPWMDVQVSRVEELILENRRVKIRRRPFHNRVAM